MNTFAVKKFFAKNYKYLFDKYIVIKCAKRKYNRYGLPCKRWQCHFYISLSTDRDS